MFRRTNTSFAVVLILSLALLSACGGGGGASKPADAGKPAAASGGTTGNASGGAAADAGGEIVIGWSASLSGGTADMGASSKNATELALEEYKAKGGKLANRIKVIYYDDEVKPDKAIQNITRLIKNDKAVVVLGPVNSGNANATIPILTQNKIPNVINVATGVPLTWEEGKPESGTPRKYVFRTSMSDLGQVPTMLKGAQAMGIKKAATLHDTTGYGVFGQQELKKRAKDFGIEIVMEQSFKLGDTDMTGQLQKAKDAGAQAVFLYTLAPELAQTFKSADKLGWYPRFYGSWTISQPATYKLAGGDLVKKFEIYMAQSFVPEMSPAAGEFDKKFRAKYGGDGFMPNAAAQSYDTMNLLIEVLEKIGPDPEKIRDELETHSGFKGVTKIRPFSSKNHESIMEEDMFLGKLEANGKITRVELK